MSERKEDFMIFSIISVLTLLWWQASQQIDMNYVFEYWSYFPNSHRLFSQVLLFLHERPVHFVNLVSISFLVSMFLVYKILDLKDEQLLVFLFACAWMVAGGYFVYCAPAYPLLAYLFKMEDWRAVFLLALVKEHAVLIAIFYFVFRKEYKKAAYSVIAASVVYTILFMLIPVNLPLGSMAVITTIEDMILYPKWVFLKSVGVFVALGLLHPFSQLEKRLILSNIILVVGFGLWWEFQLWMPLIVLFLLHRKKEMQILFTIDKGGLNQID